MQHDLNRLKIFYHVYAQNSVVGAAKVLNLSQPAVSQHLQKLEKELKVQLFTRVHKKLVPTAAGHKLYQMVEPFLRELPDLLQALRYPANAPYGLVRIGAPYEFGKEYLPGICHAFRTLYPEVRFNIRLGEPFPMVDLLKEGVIDFAVIDLVLATVQLLGKGDFYSIDSLIDEELALICSREYYERKIRGDHSFENLIEKEYISDEHDNMFLMHWFSHHFQKPVTTPNVVITVESHQANLSCVKLGMGLTVTSSHMVWEEIKAGSIVPITTGTKNAINTISLMQLQDKVPTITEKTFHAHIKASMKQDSILKKFNILPARHTSSG